MTSQDILKYRTSRAFLRMGREITLSNLVNQVGGLMPIADPQESRGFDEEVRTKLTNMFIISKQVVLSELPRDIRDMTSFSVRCWNSYCDKDDFLEQVEIVK